MYVYIYIYIYIYISVRNRALTYNKADHKNPLI